MRKIFRNALIFLTIISGITTMLSAPLWVRIGSFCALCIALLCLTLIAIRSRRIPQVDSLWFLPQAPYEVLKANEDDIRWVSDTAQRVYSGIDVIPNETMLEWFAANPTGFSIIKDCNGHRCGNIDIIPLKPNTLSRFLHGDLIEREIRGEAIFSPTESRQIKFLYIESLVALSENDKANPFATYRCIMSTPDLVKRICVPSQVEKVYAIGASRNGIRLMRHLGFDRIKYEGKRRDGHQVFLVGFRDLCRNIARHANGNDKNKLMDILSVIGAKPTL